MKEKIAAPQTGRDYSYLLVSRMGKRETGGKRLEIVPINKKKRGGDVSMFSKTCRSWTPNLRRISELNGTYSGGARGPAAKEGALDLCTAPTVGGRPFARNMKK